VNQINLDIGESSYFEDLVQYQSKMSNSFPFSLLLKFVVV